MPLYEYKCPNCGKKAEKILPLSKCNLLIICDCGTSMDKTFTKLTTVWKDRDRKWGTSLYRSHDRGERFERGKKVRKKEGDEKDE